MNGQGESSFQRACMSRDQYFSFSLFFTVFHLYKQFSKSAVVDALFSVATSKKVVGNEQVPGLKNGMDYVQLGDSDLVVSKICMGTVSWTKSTKSIFRRL